MHYDVIVGGQGTVYSGENRARAEERYQTYLATGAPVLLLEEGEVIKQCPGNQGE